MIIPDVNLLLYAVIAGFPQHPRAHAWFESNVNSPARLGLTEPVVFGFLRIATNARILSPPLPVSRAVSYVREWIGRPNVELLLPGTRHLAVALELLEIVGTAGNLTTDVQVAAYAIEHDAEVHSNDTDFGRFPDVKWVDPLK